jgi:hypothetical protein
MTRKTRIAEWAVRNDAEGTVRGMQRVPEGRAGL